MEKCVGLLHILMSGCKLVCISLYDALWQSCIYHIYGYTYKGVSTSRGKIELKNKIILESACFSHGMRFPCMPWSLVAHMGWVCVYACNTYMQNDSTVDPSFSWWTDGWLFLGRTKSDVQVKWKCSGTPQLSHRPSECGKRKEGENSLFIALTML